MIGSSTLGIGVTMFLRDQFSGPAARISGSANRMQADLLRAQQQQLRYERNLYAGIALAGAAAIRGMSKSVKLGASFRYEMEGVRAVTGSSAGNLKVLSTTAQDLGRNTMFLSSEVASGMRFMGMAGMQWQEINKNIVAATNLAGATQSVIGGKGGAADIMTNVMKAFNIAALDSMRVADILTDAVTSSNTNVFDLGEALKYAGATAMDLNIPLEEATAMVMALGNAGMQGSMAGVAMENSMRYLARTVGSFASGKQNKSLEMMGLTADDFKTAEGNLKSMTDVIGLVKNALESTYGQGENVIKQGILQNMFGVRGKRAGSLLIRNYDEFVKFKKMMNFESMGESSRIMDQMMKTMEGQMLRTKAALQNLSIAFSKGLEPVLQPIFWLVEKIGAGLKRVFDNKIIGPMLSGAIAGFTVWITMLGAYKAIIAGVRLAKLNMAAASTVMGNSTVAAYGRMTAAARAYQASAIGPKLLMPMGMATRLGPGSYGSISKAGIMSKAKNPGAAITKALYAKAPKGLGAMRGIQSMAVGGMAARGMIGLGGRILGFLGGPVGMALSFGIPAAIGLLSSIINKNKDATEENTNQLKSNADKVGITGTNRRHEIEFVNNYRPAIDYARGMGFKGATQKGMDSQEFRNQLMEFLGIAKAGLVPKTIVINIDGHTYDVDPSKLDMANIGF